MTQEKSYASDPLVINSSILAPELDISLFSPYKIRSDIDGLPTNQTASAVVTGINGDGGQDWNYYANGIADSDSRTYTLNYDNGLDKWVSGNIYPDSIYPEIYFAPSSTTWNNAPSNTVLRRNNYQLLHFENPLTMTGEMSFWIELNAYRRSAVNSADLEVFLVEENHALNYFQNDWRAKAGVELVGTITKDANFNHSHSANSSHHLVSLSSNNDGSVGAKNLRIDNDFWLIVYSQSPNDARGWDFRYQNSSLCNNNSRWYAGSQAGWTTNLQAGCPDAHIHLARRSNSGGVRDGVKIVATTSYEGETASKTSNLYYNELPNLAPNSTSFTSPSVGGTYEGNIPVSWDAASDANNDSLTYSIYLLDSNGDQYGSALATDTSNLSLTLATETPGDEIPNGQYSLSGEVCDQGVPGNDPPDPPLCTDFALPGNFYINNIDPIYSLGDIELTTTNTNSNYADTNDTITLTFTSSGIISQPTISIYSGGSAINNAVNVSNVGGTVWTASFAVSSLDVDGDISFHISSEELDLDYFDTTDGSYILVDQTDPIDPVATPSAGTFSQPQTVALTTTFGDTIRYTIDNSNLTCSTGTIYTAPLTVSYPQTVRAIGCDTIGHSSNVSNFYYFIFSHGGSDEEEGELPSNNVSTIVTESLNLAEIFSTPYTEKNSQESSDITLYNLTVKVTLNGNPLPNINIDLYSKISTAMTNSEGIAYFENIEAGEHTLKTIYNNNSYEKNFVLEKNTISSENIALAIDFSLEGASVAENMAVDNVDSKTAKNKSRKNWWWLLVIIPVFLIIYKRRRKL